jgi:hypothetical protein
VCANSQDATPGTTRDGLAWWVVTGIGAVGFICLIIEGLTGNIAWLSGTAAGFGVVFAWWTWKKLSPNGPCDTDWSNHVRYMTMVVLAVLLGGLAVVEGLNDSPVMVVVGVSLLVVGGVMTVAELRDLRKWRALDRRLPPMS